MQGVSQHRELAAGCSVRRRDSYQQLQTLREHGVAECLAAGVAETTWRLSQYGSANLRVGQELQRPEPVFRVLEDVGLETLEDASSWQLFAALSDNGFQVQARPKTKQTALQLPPHTSESVNLVMYVASASLTQTRKYMMALLRADVMFEQGALTRIHHCQPAACYVAILAGASAGSPMQALEDVEPQAALVLDVEPDLDLEPVVQPPAPRLNP